MVGKIKNIALLVFSVSFLGYGVYNWYLFEYDFFYHEGVVTGVCIKQRWRKGIGVNYKIEGKSYFICDRKNNNERLKKGQKIYLRILNTDYSQGCIDIKKTRRSDSQIPILEIK